MTALEASLWGKLSAALRWEKTKRREGMLLRALCYALFGSLALLPAMPLLPFRFTPHLLPLALFLLLLLGMRLLNPWTRRDSLIAVVRLDKALKLQERVVTAWEILQRGEERPAARLVLAEAERGLKGAEPRALFKRRLSWPAALAPLLLVVWFLATGTQLVPRYFAPATSSLLPFAQRLKETALAVEEKARERRLTETLEMARALDELAEKMAGGSVSESEARESLQALGRKIEEKLSARRSDLDWRQAPAGELSELRSRLDSLEAARLQAEGAEDELMEKLAQALASFPWLNRQSPEPLAQSGRMDREELQSLAAKWAEEISAELDRRGLEEMREVLGLAMPGEQGEMARGDRGEEAAQGAEEIYKTEGEDAGDEGKGGGPGKFPGDQPGKKDFAGPLPSFKGRAATHLKGLVGEGKASGLALRGGAEAKPGQVSEEEVLASYERQAEEEIASEEVPEELKEAVKNYFLSLGMGR